MPPFKFLTDTHDDLYIQADYEYLPVVACPKKNHTRGEHDC